MKIDVAMMDKVGRALEQAGGIYTLDDIDLALSTGNMQSHTADGTWVITQVHDFPQKRAVDVLYVIGDLRGAYAVDKVVEKWAIGIGAELMTAIGRDGWAKRLGPGWMKAGTFYCKDLNHGRQ